MKTRTITRRLELAPRPRLSALAAVLLGSASMVAFTGCVTGTEMSTPEAAAETWLQAQADGDVEKLAKLTLGAEWDLESFLPETRVSGITDYEVLNVEQQDRESDATVDVRWTLESGQKVETTLALEHVGNGYKLVAPEQAIPDIRPPALPVESWVNPDSEHLDPSFVPECGESGIERWCAEFSGYDAERYAMLPFGDYLYTVRSNAIGVVGSPLAAIRLEDYGQVRVALSGDLFDMDSSAVSDIDAAFAELVAECSVIGPEEAGRCAHPGATVPTSIDPDSWQAFRGGESLQLHVSAAEGAEPIQLVYHYDGTEGADSLQAADPALYPAPR